MCEKQNFLFLSSLYIISLVFVPRIYSSKNYYCVTITWTQNKKSKGRSLVLLRLGVSNSSNPMGRMKVRANLQAGLGLIPCAAPTALGMHNVWWPQGSWCTQHCRQYRESVQGASPGSHVLSALQTFWAVCQLILSSPRPVYPIPTVRGAGQSGWVGGVSIEISLGLQWAEHAWPGRWARDVGGQGAVSGSGTGR